MDRAATLRLITEVAPLHGLDPVLVAAVVEQESSFDPRALRGEPHAGDSSRGLMQLLLGTARWMGFDGEPDALYDVPTNLEYGCRFLRFLMHRYSGHARTALAAYNAGPGNADTRGWHCARQYVEAVLDRMDPLAESVAAARSGEPQTGLRRFHPFPLPVPFVSQLEPDGKGYNNCGPACVTMALAYNGHAPATQDVMHRVAEEVRRLPWHAGTYTNFPQMSAAARRFGISHHEVTDWDGVMATLDRGQPVLILLDNALLEPRQYPRGPAFNAHHFVIIAGYTEAEFHVADPLSVRARALATYTRPSVTAAVAAVGGVQALAIDAPAPQGGSAADQGGAPESGGLGDAPAAEGTVTLLEGTHDVPIIRISDAELKTYLEQFGRGVNMDSAIIKRACLAYRRGETRGPAVSDEYPARASDGREVVRQRFSAGIAEYDPATGEVNWVEVVAYPETLAS